MAGKASFNWIDPLLLDQQLTEEERMVRDTVRSFVEEQYLPIITEHYRELLSHGAIPLTLDRAPLCARTARPMVVASDSRTASLVVRFLSEGGR